MLNLTIFIIKLVYQIVFENISRVDKVAVFETQWKIVKVHGLSLIYLPIKFRINLKDPLLRGEMMENLVPHE
jgi:hypothetical protein